MMAWLARLFCFGVVLAIASPAVPQMSFGPAAQRGGLLGITDLDRRRLAAAADKLAPQRPGTPDAYVVVAALDSDPVFAREAREAAKVLARRYDAAGRTLLLAGADGRSIEMLARGSLETLETALNRVAAVMDYQEDALILYITAHGTPAGLAYREQGEFLATLPPTWLDYVLRHGRLRNRLVIISACFSGLFVPALSSPEGAVITAAAADRTSFGCASDNDWTFFGDALINHALRKNQPLATAFGEAKGLVGGWEAKGKLIPSNPQIAIGAQTSSWLRPIEARMPREAGVPVGRPAIESIDKAVAANH
ncbi:C13 family peptidase [Sphingomonas montanisoli]|uniref:Peptidase C13 n=1 Tax=Sphingomonas montanisoli TaxID=2606412 RepID=A0A5D9CB45_9SPHN|nr:C13 family peptidase [Sphingomonas montanisoli]TZG27341.1 peptidase C13 [Sphingomonas montanisoli]